MICVFLGFIGYGRHYKVGNLSLFFVELHCSAICQKDLDGFACPFDSVVGS